MNDNPASTPGNLAHAPVLIPDSDYFWRPPENNMAEIAREAREKSAGTASTD
jgi:hypothetical protein